MSTPTFQRKRLRSVQPLHVKLAHVRQVKGVSLADVEDAIKIRLHHLQHIESGDYDRLPPAHAKGFIRRYADYLGLDGLETQQAIASLLPRSPRASLFLPHTVVAAPRWVITPKTVVATIIAALVVVLVGYVVNQVRQFAAPPDLAIFEPADRTAVQSDRILVRGVTSVGASVVINDASVGIDRAGEFRFDVGLRPGLNQITIRSTNRVDKVTTKTVTVLYDAAVAPASPTPQPSPTQ